MEQTTIPNAPAKSPAKVHHAVAACAAEEDELSAARSGAAVAHGVTINESTMIEAPRARGARMSVRATLRRRSAEQETASTGTAVPCEAYRRMCFNESEPTCIGGRSAFGRGCATICQAPHASGTVERPKVRRWRGQWARCGRREVCACEALRRRRRGAHGVRERPHTEAGQVGGTGGAHQLVRCAVDSATDRREAGVAARAWPAGCVTAWLYDIRCKL